MRCVLASTLCNIGSLGNEKQGWFQSFRAGNDGKDLINRDLKKPEGSFHLQVGMCLATCAGTPFRRAEARPPVVVIPIIEIGYDNSPEETAFCA